MQSTGFVLVQYARTTKFPVWFLVHVGTYENTIMTISSCLGRHWKIVYSPIPNFAVWATLLNETCSPIEQCLEEIIVRPGVIFR